MTRTRRDVLRASGVALTGGIAGCLGAGDGDGMDNGEDADDDDDAGPTTTDVEALPTPTLGPDDAPVTVAVYTDYACPHCQRYTAETLPRIREEYVSDGVVRYEHHDFPIPVDDRWSWQVASAARGVQDSGGDAAFFEFTSAIYPHLESYSLDVIRSTAEAVGADPESIETAAAEELYRPVVQADREAAADRGVERTPTILVDGEPTSHYELWAVRGAIESARP
mgnify:CR=1 FL=1